MGGAVATVTGWGLVDCSVIQVEMCPLFPPQSEAAKVFHEEQARKRAELQATDLSRYSVGGAEEEWAESLAGNQPGMISIR